MIDGGMFFRTTKGGRMMFVHHTTGKGPATISIATDGRSDVEVMLPEELEGDGLFFGHPKPVKPQGACFRIGCLTRFCADVKRTFHVFGEFRPD